MYKAAGARKSEERGVGVSEKVPYMKGMPKKESQDRAGQGGQEEGHRGPGSVEPKPRPDTQRGELGHSGGGAACGPDGCVWGWVAGPEDAGSRKDPISRVGPR